MARSLVDLPPVALEVQRHLAQPRAARNTPLLHLQLLQPAAGCCHGLLQRSVLTWLRHQRFNHCLPAPNKTAQPGQQQQHIDQQIPQHDADQ
ncbi:hypothetical protein SDC9_175119 [bioreactor metagenome]|uniref:Uncharacterized protein n=1 Tax=bioreactor metagenome TaxID=1076179 RepID=A0A645GLU1_9ZZZZ